uniref:Fibrinogen C-terminal domain-containing protein n=1 Tax=Mola mola TaxID=94237 RepID=A0A3Q3W6Y3_MOLML
WSWFSAVLLLVPLLTACHPLLLPADCSHVSELDGSRPSGVYTIYPIGATSAVRVYCDMDSQGGRWTVFQRRMDGSLNFYRPWNQYKMGFGNAAGEYWLGLENIHQLTHNWTSELLVTMEDFEGHQVFAGYSSFSVGTEADGYVLSVSGFSEGGAGAYELYCDQDIWSGNCARKFLGAFWYSNCHSTNPNGVYRWGSDGTLYAVGVSWYGWKGHDYSLKAISMKIRPVQCCQQN